MLVENMKGRDLYEDLCLEVRIILKWILRNMSANFGLYSSGSDRLRGLVVRVPGYRSTGPGFDSQRYQIFSEVVGLERGPLSPMRIIKELLERTVAAPV
jgi:hypothetical protein